MRIISWNVNGIRATEKKWEIQNLIEKYDPDIFFMQEIKAKPDQLSEYLLHPPGYRAHYNPAEKPGYAGTGVWIHDRVREIADVRFIDSFPWDPTADEGRVAHVELVVTSDKWQVKSLTARHSELAKNPEKKNGSFILQDDEIRIIDIFCIYFPNGGKSEEAWQGKLVFYREFARYMDELRSQWHDVLWWWDLNCAHHEIDLARPKANEWKIGFHPLERAWLDGRVRDGWYDIYRSKYPEARDVYSWWDVITRSRATNVGWRIDAWWGSEWVYANTRNIEYLPNHMWSDHCPILVDIEME